MPLGETENKCDRNCMKKSHLWRAKWAGACKFGRCCKVLPLLLAPCNEQADFMTVANTRYGGIVWTLRWLTVKHEMMFCCIRKEENQNNVLDSILFSYENFFVSVSKLYCLGRFPLDGHVISFGHHFFVMQSQLEKVSVYLLGPVTHGQGDLSKIKSEKSMNCSGNIELQLPTDADFSA